MADGVINFSAGGTLSSRGSVDYDTNPKFTINLSGFIIDQEDSTSKPRVTRVSAIITAPGDRGTFTIANLRATPIGDTTAEIVLPLSTIDIKVFMEQVAHPGIEDTPGYDALEDFEESAGQMFTFKVRFRVEVMARGESYTADDFSSSTGAEMKYTVPYSESDGFSFVDVRGIPKSTLEAAAEGAFGGVGALRYLDLLRVADAFYLRKHGTSIGSTPTAHEPVSAFFSPVTAAVVPYDPVTESAGVVRQTEHYTARQVSVRGLAATLMSPYKNYGDFFESVNTIPGMINMTRSVANLTSGAFTGLGHILLDDLSDLLHNPLRYDGSSCGTGSFFRSGFVYPGTNTQVPVVRRSLKVVPKHQFATNVIVSLGTCGDTPQNLFEIQQSTTETGNEESRTLVKLGGAAGMYKAEMFLCESAKNLYYQPTVDPVSFAVWDLGPRHYTPLIVEITGEVPPPNILKEIDEALYSCVYPYESGNNSDFRWRTRDDEYGGYSCFWEKHFPKIPMWSFPDIKVRTRSDLHASLSDVRATVKSDMDNAVKRKQGLEQRKLDLQVKIQEYLISPDQEKRDQVPQLQAELKDIGAAINQAKARIEELEVLCNDLEDTDKCFGLDSRDIGSLCFDKISRDHIKFLAKVLDKIRHTTSSAFSPAVSVYTDGGIFAYGPGIGCRNSGAYAEPYCSQRYISKTLTQKKKDGQVVESRTTYSHTRDYEPPYMYSGSVLMKDANNGAVVLADKLACGIEITLDLHMSRAYSSSASEANTTRNRSISMSRVGYGAGGISSESDVQNNYQGIDCVGDLTIALNVSELHDKETGQLLGWNCRWNPTLGKKDPSVSEPDEGLPEEKVPEDIDPNIISYAYTCENTGVTIPEYYSFITYDSRDPEAKPDEDYHVDKKEYEVHPPQNYRPQLLDDQRFDSPVMRDVFFRGCPRLVRQKKIKSSGIVLVVYHVSASWEWVSVTTSDTRSSQTSGSSNSAVHGDYTPNSSKSMSGTVWKVYDWQADPTLGCATFHHPPMDAEFCERIVNEFVSHAEEHHDDNANTGDTGGYGDVDTLGIPFTVSDLESPLELLNQEFERSLVDPHIVPESHLEDNDEEDELMSAGNPDRLVVEVSANTGALVTLYCTQKRKLKYQVHVLQMYVFTEFIDEILPGLTMT